MTKNLTIITILISLLLTSCNSKKSENEIIVDRLLNYSFDTPPSPELSFIPLYIRQSDSIIYATTYDLKQFYDSKNYSQNISFHSFILNSFNQEINIKDTSQYLNSFKLDTTIYKEYTNRGFNFITNKYTEKREDEFDLKYSIADFGKESTISYVFFLNNYFALFDDVDGETSYVPFRKRLNIPEDD